MKKIIALIGVVVLLTACAPVETEVKKPDQSELEKLPVLTLEELSEFDGKNGNKAYVAVDGIIYDVTDVKPWANGDHNGNTAGNDLTEEIAKSPHGVKNLVGLPIVGTLAE